MKECFSILSNRVVSALGVAYTLLSESKPQKEHPQKGLAQKLSKNLDLNLQSLKNELHKSSCLGYEKQLLQSPSLSGSSAKYQYYDVEKLCSWLAELNKLIWLKSDFCQAEDDWLSFESDEQIYLSLKESYIKRISISLKDLGIE